MSEKKCIVCDGYGLRPRPSFAPGDGPIECRVCCGVGVVQMCACPCCTDECQCAAGRTIMEIMTTATETGFGPGFQYEPDGTIVYGSGHDESVITTTLRNLAVAKTAGLTVTTWNLS